MLKYKSEIDFPKSSKNKVVLWYDKLPKIGISYLRTAFKKANYPFINSICSLYYGD